MNPHNSRLLYRRYPRLYSQPLLFGIECGDGWFNLIDRLSAQVEAECLRLRDEENMPAADLPVVTQVKQKMGGLRFYLSSTPPLIHDMCNMAETASRCMCEACGGSGMPQRLPGRGWLHVLCDNCVGNPPAY